MSDLTAQIEAARAHRAAVAATEDDDADWRQVVVAQWDAEITRLEVRRGANPAPGE